MPDAVKSLSKVPFVIDMHGGGGCASQEAASSGFKELSDTLGKDGFILAWPQGYDQGWGTCGADCTQVATESTKEGGKSIASQDDITFLTDVVAHMVKSQDAANPAKGRIDTERVYTTGFSMGWVF